MLKYRIRWTKTTDSAKLQRTREIKIITPIERDTTPLEDALLSLPSLKPTFNEDTFYIDIEIPCSHEPTDDQLIPLIEQEFYRRHGENNKWEAQQEAARNASIKKFEEIVCDLEASPIEGSSYYPIPRIENYYPQPLVDRFMEYCAKVDKFKIERDAKLVQAAIDKREKESIRDKERRVYIKDWSIYHGSDRLKGQLELGLDGWPLYLHDRLACDLGKFYELNNDGIEEDIKNPSSELVEAGLELKTNLVSLGYENPSIRLVNLLFEADMDDADCVVFDNYWPGPKELFNKVSIRRPVTCHNTF